MDEGGKESTLVAGIPHFELTGEKIKDNRQFSLEVQCSGDNGIDAEFRSTTIAPNKLMMPQTNKQLKPLDELKDVIKETNQVKKLVFFPPQSDKPVK